MFLDGGVRQGTDVLKALALGAKAVFVGRPVLWGLACGGRQGVEQVLGMLKDELKLAMQLAGKLYFYIFKTSVLRGSCNSNDREGPKFILMTT